MPHKVNFHPRFERDLKAFKNDKATRNAIRDQVAAVIENPGLGVAYVGNLRGLFKVSFGARPEFRLIYRKYVCCQKSEPGSQCPVSDPDVTDGECEGVVSFVFIKTREECNNLYKKEKAYFEGTAHEGLEPAV